MLISLEDEKLMASLPSLDDLELLDSLSDKAQVEQVLNPGAAPVVAASSSVPTLGEDLGAGRWSVRAQVRPLINYVWLAALLMAIGGIIAACDRRYRKGDEEVP